MMEGRGFFAGGGEALVLAGPTLLFQGGDLGRVVGEDLPVQGVMRTVQSPTSVMGKNGMSGTKLLDESRRKYVAS